MPNKPIELPPTVAKAFVQDMRAFFAAPNMLRQNEIAARQLHALKQHHPGKLRLADVKQMFLEMRDQSSRLSLGLEAPESRPASENESGRPA